MSSRIEITRQGLWELVWTKPMRDIAATIPMSDVGLKKVCRKVGIPIPPQGHWNKLRAGKRSVNKPPLLPRPPGVAELVIGNETRSWTEISLQMETDISFVPVPPAFAESLDEVRRRIAAGLRPVIAAKQLRNPHPAVKRRLDADEAHVRHYSFEKPKFENPFEQRRLRIVDAVFKALSVIGYKPQIQGAEARDCSVTIGDHNVTFDIDAASAKRQREQPEWPPQDHGPDQKARLRIRAYPEDAEWGRTWIDGSRPVEESLTEFVAALIYAGEAQYRFHLQSTYDDEIERLKAARARQIQKAKEEERERCRRIEKKKQEAIAQLVNDAENWKLADTIRSYIQAVLSARGDEPDGAKWAAWASSIADGIDPLHHRSHEQD